jgi:hypothetical protein
MDVVRGSLREFGVLLNVMTGGVPDVGGDAGRGQPRRGPVWIVVQVAALAVLLSVLFAVAELFVDAPDPGTVAASAAWFLPGFLLALPMTLHWFARPERRGPGVAAAVVSAVVVAVAVAPVFAALPGIWAGLLTLVPAMLVAAAVFGAVAPVPAQQP